ncbi:MULTISPECIES: amino acid ABC transporter permease [Pseudomonas]|uniref:amino acid ABC transporter permease n=1 Tax=Pseudomonas TaxID=286 RepID=UPI000E3B5B57|nr:MULTISPECIES: amino acid ABC transporter permease [Pseudomonas]MBK4998967.1 amino acid ABC transporter permease [Pseudomonas sp. S31]
MWDLFLRSLPLLQTAFLMTLGLGFASFVLGCVLGLAIALLRNSQVRILRTIAFAYVSIFRGTPLLVQMLLIYFGLPHYGIVVSPIPSALIALSLFAAAYLSEIFRSGINSVDPGQWEAADSMSMGYWVCLRRIILPQAFRIALPPMGSRLIALIKDTSLASTITVMELTRVAEQVGAATFKYMEMFVMVGAMYWVVNQLLTILQTWLEGRWTRHMR